jgi:hypothetical protein
MKPYKRMKLAIPPKILRKYHPIPRPQNKKRNTTLSRCKTLLYLQKILVRQLEIIPSTRRKQNNIEVKVRIQLDGQEISIILQAK